MNNNPISKTAYYCCGVRMQDAQTSKPICNDIYAERFMDSYGSEIFKQFSEEEGVNISNVSRHRIIDDYLRGVLLKDRNTTIVTIGAGFDSRPYRLEGGCWVELDEPNIIEAKNRLLPVTECKNKVQRVSIAFGAESLQEKLAVLVGAAPCVFVMEGVFFYVSESAIAQTLQCLRQAIPHHELVCDVMQKEMLEKHSDKLRKKIELLGAQMYEHTQTAQLITNGGYRLKSSISITGKLLEFRLPRWIAGLVRLLMPPLLLNGYTISIFESNA